MNAGSLGGLLLLGLIWGASYLFIKLAVAEIAPAQLVAARLLIATLTLLGPMLIGGRGLPRGRTLWRDLAVMGLLSSAAPFTLISWGETNVPSGVAAVLNATTPLFAVLFAHALVPEERVTLRSGLGVLVGFAGVAVLIGPDLASLATASALGELAVVGASACYAAAAVWARLRLRGEPLALATGQMIAAFIWMVPVVLLFSRERPESVSWVAILSTLELGILGTGIAYLIYYWLIARVGAVRTTLVTYIIPVAGLILGAVFLAETVQWNAIAGLLLIALGISVVQGVGPDRLWSGRVERGSAKGA
jgi:drug/metabolite transporter (DMT)-like permease